jgi:fluoride ion exporter CrcB/FEX
MWKSVIAISFGAALGALLRWVLGTKLNSVFPTVPPGTLAANVIGGYIIGVGIAFFAWSIPRYRGDAANLRGGMRGVIPSKQHY